MASIKFGNIVVDMRGKVSGNVYAKNKGGAYSRVKVKPSNPRTTSQNAVRAAFTSLSQGWKGLTESQRTSWLQGAKNFPVKNRLGDSIILNGNSLYVALNKNLSDVGVAALSECPAPAAVTPVAVSVASASFGSQTVTVTLGGAVPADTSVKLFASPTVSAGVNSIGTKQRQIASYAPAHAAALAPTTEYLAKFGAVGAVGSKIFVTVVTVNNLTGQVGQSLTSEIVIGA